MCASGGGIWAKMKAALLVLWALWALPAAGQELSGLARLDAAASEIDGGEVTLALSQPVPWRVRVLDDPARVVLDFREGDWAGLAAMLRAGFSRPGWPRLVLRLAEPMLVDQAEMVTGEGAALHLSLRAADAAEFAAKAALPEPPEWSTPKLAELAAPAPKGHGGLDPGAERDGQTEAALMLTFARELKELLVRDGSFAVVMTREDDTFVPLETRISIARAAGAGVFVSLHADAIAEGEAVGATVYTLAEDATDEAAAALAERHDRDDLLAGVDLTEQDDLVATVLMDMARTETAPRIDRLAAALETEIKAQGLKMHRHPRQQAGFSVLKSPDIPSVLVELGFLSSSRDLWLLMDVEWRARMAGALRDGLKSWAAEDAALDQLRAT